MDVSAPFSSHNKVPFVTQAALLGCMRRKTICGEEGFVKITLEDKRGGVRNCVLSHCYWKVLQVFVQTV